MQCNILAHMFIETSTAYRPTVFSVCSKRVSRSISKKGQMGPRKTQSASINVYMSQFWDTCQKSELFPLIFIMDMHGRTSKATPKEYFNRLLLWETVLSANLMLFMTAGAAYSTAIIDFPRSLTQVVYTGVSPCRRESLRAGRQGRVAS